MLDNNLPLYLKNRRVGRHDPKQHGFFAPPEEHWKEIYQASGAIHRLARLHLLEGHHGCVNTVAWNNEGSLLISGSDDTHLMIWGGHNFEMKEDIITDHTRNIFSAKLVPHNNGMAVSTGMDGHVHLTFCGEGVGRPGVHLHHSSPGRLGYKIDFHPSMPSVCISAHDEALYLFDLRQKESGSNGKQELVKLSQEPAGFLSRSRDTAASIAFNPVQHNQFATSGGDPLVRLYDLRFVGESPSFAEGVSGRASAHCIQTYCSGRVYQELKSGMRGGGGMCVTHIAFSPQQELAASYAGQPIYLWDINPDCNTLEEDIVGTVPSQTPEGVPICSKFSTAFVGNRNTQTFLKAVTFAGPQGEYICAGSDCGYLYVWDRHTGRIVQHQKADDRVLNCATPHPALPYIACSGIDSDIKIMGPTPDKTLDEEECWEVIEKNRMKLHSENHTYSAYMLQKLSQLRRQDGIDHPTYPVDHPDRLDPNFRKKCLSVAEEIRTKGNNAFREKRYSDARDLYRKALRYLQYRPSSEDSDDEDTESEEQANERQKQMISCLGNSAQCCLTLGPGNPSLYNDAISLCDQILKLDCTNSKAWYRRASAHFHKGNLESAEKDLHNCSEGQADSGTHKLQKEIQKMRKKKDEAERRLGEKWLGGLCEESPKPKRGERTRDGPSPSDNQSMEEEEDGEGA